MRSPGAGGGAKWSDGAGSSPGHMNSPLSGLPVGGTIPGTGCLSNRVEQGQEEEGPAGIGISVPQGWSPTSWSQLASPLLPDWLSTLTSCLQCWLPYCSSPRPPQAAFNLTPGIRLRPEFPHSTCTPKQCLGHIQRLPSPCAHSSGDTWI